MIQAGVFYMGILKCCLGINSNLGKLSKMMLSMYFKLLVQFSYQLYEVGIVVLIFCLNFRVKFREMEWFSLL